MKLKAKLFWVVFISVFIGVFALNGVLTIVGNVLDDGYEPNQLKQIALKLQDDSGSHSGVSVPELLQIMSEQHKGLVFDWFAPDGTLLATTNAEKGDYTAGELLARFANVPPGEENLAKVFRLVLQEENGYLAITALPGHVRSQYALLYFKEIGLFAVYMAPIVLFLFAPALAAVLLTVSITRRIRLLNRAMQSTDLNKIDVSLNDRSRDEIGQLTRLFVEMSLKIRKQFEQLQHVEQQRRGLVSNLSHNLRTPLTSVIGYADALNRGLDRTPDERRQWVAIIASRSLYMERLLKQLFKISLSHDNSEMMKKQLCDMCELVRGIAAEYVPLMEDKDISFIIDIPDKPLYAPINSEQMDQAVRNLLDNGITYGIDGSYIGLRVEQTGQEIALSVEDRGKGIPQTEQERIFGRFYRYEGSIGYNGAGIGLFFVNEAAKEHEGTVDLYSVPYVKTVFTIRLPCQVEAPDRLQAIQTEGTPSPKSSFEYMEPE